MNEIWEMSQLVDQYSDDIYSFCLKLTGNKEDGEDLYQLTFIKAYEKRSKIDLTNNPKSYLLGISVRLWKNEKRKRWRRHQIVPVVDEGFDECCMATEEDASRHLEKKEIHKAIQSSLLKLPDKLRVPLTLFYYMELDVKEIAVSLKIPQGTVKSRLYKGRQKLKQYLEECGYGEI